MRIVFFGTPDLAAIALRRLLASRHTIVGVVCQPDKPAGRGQHLTAPPVKDVALAANVPVAQPEKVRDGAFTQVLQAWNPDLIVVAAYGKILPRHILDLPRLGCINIHASLLPQLRGAAPIQWAIARGASVTGVTIMQMNEGMDTGDILLQQACPIAATDTGQTLYDRLAALGAELVLEAIEGLEAGSLKPTPQDPTAATLAPILRKEDGRIAWSRPASEIERLIRAFDPWPSTYCFVADKRLRVLRAHVVATTRSATPGQVHLENGEVMVTTGDGALILDELQLEGRKRMSATELLRGSGLTPGMVLS